MKNLILNRFKISFAVVAGASLLIVFQNCTDVQFGVSQNSSSEIVLGGPSLNAPYSALLCAAGHPAPATAQTYYPTQCLVNPNLPANSLGIEMNNNFMLGTGASSVISLAANDPVGGISANTNLYVEISTFLAPDTIVISSVDAAGMETQRLNICNIGTYSSGDPTNAMERPYSDTILQFMITIPKGTTKLKLDFTQADTNTYFGIWNLNEFSSAVNDPSTNPFATNSNTVANQYRVLNRPISTYNDNADPLRAEPSCF